MITLVFDTETTGMVVRGAGPEHPGQPGIVQLGAILYRGREVEAEINLIVRPADVAGDTMTISPEATAVHGIDADRAERFGVPEFMALGVLGELARAADRVVAYNAAFDLIVVGATCMRMASRGGFVPVNEALLKPRVCAMLAASRVLKIPGRRGDYAWPKLIDAYNRLVDPAGFAGAHDAMADVRACAAVLWALEDGGHAL